MRVPSVPSPLLLCPHPSRGGGETQTDITVPQHRDPRGGERGRGGRRGPSVSLSPSQQRHGSRTDGSIPVRAEPSWTPPPHREDPGGRGGREQRCGARGCASRASNGVPHPQWGPAPTFLREADDLKAPLILGGVTTSGPFRLQPPQRPSHGNARHRVGDPRPFAEPQPVQQLPFGRLFQQPPFRFGSARRAPFCRPAQHRSGEQPRERAARRHRTDGTDRNGTGSPRRRHPLWAPANGGGPAAPPPLDGAPPVPSGTAGAGDYQD